MTEQPRPITRRDVVFCPICGAPIQRMLHRLSSPMDGLRAHMKVVHPEEQGKAQP